MRKRRPGLLVACLLLASLPSCFTQALWQERHLRDEATRTTTPSARATDARLVHAPDGDTVYVWLAVAERPPRAFALQPYAAFADEFTAAVDDAEAPRLALRVHYHHWSNGYHEWQAQLDATPAIDPRATHVPMSIAPLLGDPPTSAGVTLAIDAVEWTDVETTSTTDPLNVAWRVAVTPLAVAADIVLVIPMAVLGVVVALTDPGLLTGG